MELVTVEQVARAAGREVADVQAELAELRVTTQPDWSGAEAVLVNEARGLVDGSLRRQVENSARNARVNREAEEFVAGRVAAVREAFQAEMEGVRDSGPARERARKKAAAAGRAFERKCPSELRNRLRPAFYDSWADASLTGEIKRKMAGDPEPTPGAEVSS